MNHLKKNINQTQKQKTIEWYICRDKKIKKKKYLKRLLLFINYFNYKFVIYSYTLRGVATS